MDSTIQKIILSLDHTYVQGQGLWIYINYKLITPPPLHIR